MALGVLTKIVFAVATGAFSGDPKECNHLWSHFMVVLGGYDFGRIDDLPKWRLFRSDVVPAKTEWKFPKSISRMMEMGSRTGFPGFGDFPGN